MPAASIRRIHSQIRATRDALAQLVPDGLAGRRPADRALAEYVRARPELGGRDRRLISDTVFAVFRWWGWLRRLDLPRALLPARGGDEPAAGSRPGDETSAWSRLILSAHLLDDLDYADVQAELAADLGSPREAVAGALRLPLGPRADRLLAMLGRSSVSLAMDALAPEWTRAEMAEPALFGRLLDWLQKRPPLWLRAQTPDPGALAEELRQLGLEPEPHPALERAFRLTRARVNLLVHSVYREGRVEVQDLASQAVGRVCAPRPGERWWDACAGGGGKTLLLAQLMDGKGRVLATDVHTGRLENLRHRVRRAGFQNVATNEWDGGAPRSGRTPFDGVLVDVPCTGSGTWRRNPHARWALPRERIAAMADQQTRLLTHAAKGVRPGGALVYSTCSIFRRENEDVVAAFLAGHADFAPDPFVHPLSGAPTGGLAMVWPWEGDCDAMFVARMRRRDADAPASPDTPTNG